MIFYLLYNPVSNESVASEFEILLKMRLLVVFLLMALIVLPTEGLFRRRRRRRWLRIRGRKVLTGVGIAARLGLIGKRDIQNDQSEVENLFDKRDAEQILQMVDMYGDSVVSHDEFIRGVEDLFSQDAE